jgi:hypothetical protein
MRNVLTVDRIFAVAFILLAAFFGWEVARLPESVAFQQISAKTWPMVLVAAALVTGALLWFDDSRAETAAPLDPDEDETPAGRAAWILLLGLLLTGPAMVYLGYWITCSGLMLLVAWLKEPADRLLRNAVASIVLPGAIYLLFTRIFEQFLPVGSLLQ